MDRKEFRELTSSEAARHIIGQIALQPDILELELEMAWGHVLAEDVISKVDVPSFDRASMDGYAVRAKDTYPAREDSPVSLEITGRVDAGNIPETSVNAGCAAEISTGAMMPVGADAAVMVEYTRMAGTRVEILRPVSINEHVIQAGSDIMVGERVLEAGTRLSARELGVLAAVGEDVVKVRHLDIGIISTGNELTHPGKELLPGRVYDINSYSLGAAVMECGARPRYYGIVRDDRQAMEELLMRAVSECHLVLTSGSTSAGQGDVMYRIIEETGRVLLHGIDIKPGKPVIVGVVDETPVFGLPGYPTSALTIFNEFTAPLLRRALGTIRPDSMTNARMAIDLRLEGRRRLLPVGLVRGLAYPVDKGSGAITTLANADGFVDIGAGVELIRAGDQVEVSLLGDVDVPDMLFIGSHCLGFEAMMRLLPRKVRMINTGSTGALVAVRDGYADLGGVHLLDDTGQYNLSFLKTFNLKDAVLVKGYLREQGLMVRPDSPINGLEDIAGRRMINRNRGSGTRILTDLKLKELSASQGTGFDELVTALEGYDTEAQTHSAVAAAVKLSRADAGVGIRPVAQLNGLKFIHLADEEYDFVVSGDFIESPMGREFLDVLKSDVFSLSLPVGIRTHERTGDIIEL